MTSGASDGSSWYAAQPGVALAEALGTQAPVLLHHFGTKEELLVQGDQLKKMYVLRRILRRASRCRAGRRSLPGRRADRNRAPRGRQSDTIRS